VAAIHLVWRYCGVCGDELLERFSASAGVVENCEAAAPRRICMPFVQNCSANRRILEVRPVPANI
jgi:hypothetical protein